MTQKILEFRKEREKEKDRWAALKVDRFVVSTPISIPTRSWAQVFNKNSSLQYKLKNQNEQNDRNFSQSNFRLWKTSGGKIQAKQHDFDFVSNQEQAIWRIKQTNQVN